MRFDFFRSPSSVATAPLAFLTFFFLAGSAGGPAYYGLSQLAQGATAVAIVAPFSAGLAAWEGARLRRAGIWQLAATRSEARIVIRALAPTALAALIALTLGVGSMMVTLPRLQASDLLVLVVPVAVVGGHIVLAHAAGRRLPAVIAVPSAVVISWLWIAYPIALEPLWLRHMTGFLTDCCDIATVLDPAAILAPLIVSAGAVAAAAILLAPISTLRRRLGAAFAVALGLAGGAATVSGMGAAPTTARPDSDVVCRAGELHVCLWPEHRGELSRVQQEAVGLRERLEEIGVATAAVVTEARSGDGERWVIGISRGLTRVEILGSLIYGLLPPHPRCAETGPYPGYAAFAPVAVWLGEHAGVPTDTLRSFGSDEDLREVRAVQRLKRSKQLDWYQTNLRALRNCAIPPRLLTRT